VSRANVFQNRSLIVLILIAIKIGSFWPKHDEFNVTHVLHNAHDVEPYEVAFMCVCVCNSASGPGGLVHKRSIEIRDSVPPSLKLLQLIRNSGLSHTLYIMIVYPVCVFP